MTTSRARVAPATPTTSIAAAAPRTTRRRLTRVLIPVRTGRMIGGSEPPLNLVNPSTGCDAGGGHQILERALLRALVLPEALEGGGPQAPGPRELAELHGGDQHGRHPVCTPQLGLVADDLAGEGAGGLTELREAGPHLGQRPVGEAGPAVARVVQARAVVDGQGEGADSARPALLALDPPGDDEVGVDGRLDLEPGMGALAG